MSHSVRITRTVTTSETTSTLILNTGYLKSLPGMLKLIQLVNVYFLFKTTISLTIMCICVFRNIQLLGGASVGLVAWYYVDRQYYDTNAELFFLLMATSFLVGTFCLLASCLFSLSTGGIISKTIYVSAHKLIRK